jgi:hypothetical protein
MERNFRKDSVLEVCNLSFELYKTHRPDETLETK